MKNVRWGLLSTARINRRLISAIRATRRGKLAAVASREIEKARVYAAEWDILLAFGSYEEMLASDEIDAVYISLPNSMHAEWTIKALEAGKHVLCEKPFATSVEEADQMIAASRSAGKVLAEGFMYRHNPQTKLVGEWVKGGRLGEITLVRGIFSFYMQNRPGNVRLMPNLGGGALWDVGVYPISFVQFIFDGPPESAACQTHIGLTGVDETFSGLLSYSGGRSAVISGSFEMPRISEIEIHGTMGSLYLNRPFTGIEDREREVIFTPVDGKPEKLRVPKMDSYQAEVEDMHDAIMLGKPPLISLEETRNHVRTACAMYESARSGQTIRL